MLWLVAGGRPAGELSGLLDQNLHLARPKGKTKRESGGKQSTKGAAAAEGKSGGTLN